jgi:transposase
MGKTPRKFDDEFRREAVRLASEPDMKDSWVERDLGLYQGAIRHWRRAFEADPQRGLGDTSRPATAEQEVKRLRRENERLKQERDILKKAAAYFSMDAIRGSRS